MPSAWFATDLIGAIQISCNSYFLQGFKSIIDNNLPNTRRAYESYAKSVRASDSKKLGIDIPGELNGNIPTPRHYDKYHGINRWRSMTIISRLGSGRVKSESRPCTCQHGGPDFEQRMVLQFPHRQGNRKEKDSMNTAYIKRRVLVDPKSTLDVVIEGWLTW